MRPKGLLWCDFLSKNPVHQFADLPISGPKDRGDDFKVGYEIETAPSVVRVTACLEWVSVAIARIRTCLAMLNRPGEVVSNGRRYRKRQRRTGGT
jgi:hypothetical protein